MSEFVSEQFAVSTAEDERNYFTGQPEAMVRPNPSAILPPGTYRVIEGSLYRVISGLPPNLSLSRAEDVESNRNALDRAQGLNTPP